MQRTAYGFVTFTTTRNYMIAKLSLRARTDMDFGLLDTVGENSQITAKLTAEIQFLKASVLFLIPTLQGLKRSYLREETDAVRQNRVSAMSKADLRSKRVETVSFE